MRAVKERQGLFGGRFSRRSRTLPDIITQSLNGEPLPLQLQAIQATNPAFKQELTGLLNSGVTMEYQEYRRLPKGMRNDFGQLAQGYGDLRLSVAQALLDGKPIAGDEGTIARVKDQIQELIKVYSPSQDPQVQEAVRRLNDGMKKERDAYAKERLLTDRTSSERNKVLITSLIAIGAGLGASVLNLKGQEGLGMALAGQLDDVANGFGVAFTKNDGKNFLKKLQGLGGVLAFAGGAGLVDYFILPSLFIAGATNPLVLGTAAGVYCLTAIAGSMVAEALDFIGNVRLMRKLDKAGKLPGKLELPTEVLHLRNAKSFQKDLTRLDQKDSLTSFVADRLKDVSLTEPVRQKIVQSISQMEVSDRHMLLDALKKESFGKVVKNAWRETLSNPFRSWLFKGFGVSLGGSLVAGFLGLLPGKGLLTPFIESLGPVVHNTIHGMTEALVGPAETFTAIFGSENEAKRLDKKRAKQLKRQA